MSSSAVIAENVFWITIIVYLLLRIPRKLRARKEHVRTSKRNTIDFFASVFNQLCAGVIPVIYIITKFPSFASYPFYPPFAVTGTITMLAALFCIFRAHFDLGPAFSTRLEIRQEHQLVTRGIYQYVRHPMYLGFLLWACGQAMLLPNWIAGFSGFIGWIFLFGSRVLREEQMMVDEFGDEYRAYMARTMRVIPGVF
jgi:protein-S-isoprenylcysteine O-methyltransferase Ste14